MLKKIKLIIELIFVQSRFKNVIQLLFGVSLMKKIHFCILLFVLAGFLIPFSININAIDIQLVKTLVVFIQ